MLVTVVSVLYIVAPSPVYEVYCVVLPGAPDVAVGDKVVVYPWRVGCESSCGPCKHDAQTHCSSGIAVESIGINVEGG